MGVLATAPSSAPKYPVYEWHGYSSVPVHSSIWESRSEGIEKRLHVPFKVPVSFFAENDIELKAVKPIAVTISLGSEGWFAENESLDIYASGDTPEDAMREFKSLLIHFYAHYKSLDPARAMGQARLLKSRFEKGFVEVAS